MKTTKYSFIIMLFTVLTVFSSCKKDNETVPAKSKTELLAGVSSKTWKIANYQVSYSGVTTSLFNWLEDCSQDDITILYANKNFEEKEGNTKCETHDLIDSGTWNLSSDETTLTMSYQDGYTEVGKIIELSASTLKFEVADPSKSGSKVIYTFKAQ